MPVRCPSRDNVRKLCEEGRLDEAVHTVELMVEKGICVSSDLFYHLLCVCTKIENLESGRRVHQLITRSTAVSDMFLGSHLIRMFAQCGSLLEANHIFDKLPGASVYAWGAIISAHSNLGQGENAIKLYHQMRQSHIKANAHIFVAVFKACSCIAAFGLGKLAHAFLIEDGLGLDVYVCNTLVDMYAKCGSIDDARIVFDKLPKRSLVSWNVIISGYAQNGNSQESLALFQEMQKEKFKLDNITLLNILKACSSRAFSRQTRLIHSCMIGIGCEQNVIMGSALIDTYAKCGDLADARFVFDELPHQSIVTWNAMITGYVQHGQGQDAVEFFQQMQQMRRQPDRVTFMSILKCCSNPADTEDARLLHTHVVQCGFESDLLVGNSLINMYVKCGSIDDSCRLFRRLPWRDVVTWTAMIGAYVDKGNGQEAFQLFLQMQQEEVHPNQVTFVSILKACSSSTALEQGKLIHTHIIENGMELDAVMGSALIGMYAKCGSLESACTVLDNLSNRTVVTWAAMMQAHALHGQYKMVLKCFKDMQRDGLQPDDGIFLCLLSACSHIGLVDEGHNHFTSVNEDCCLSPTIEHYTCMSGLLGQSGHLKEAEYLFGTMPLQPDIAAWVSLLSSCKRYGNMEVGSRCFDHAVTMDARYASAYVLMSNMYDDLDMQEPSENIQELRKSANSWKKAARASFELENQVHEFSVGETGHRQIDDIYSKVSRLGGYFKEKGHVPYLNLVPHSS